MDSGAGRCICNASDLPGVPIQQSDHPGFRGAGGDGILVKGKATVKLRDNVGGREATATFLAAAVTRPILSTGEICDRGNVAIHGAHGAFIVDEIVARPILEQLKPHAKMVFARKGAGGLYELNANLIAAPFQWQE